MARNPKDPGGSATPQKFPEIPPPQYSTGEYSYILEAVMGMQSALGRLSEAVDGLKEKSKSNSDKLDQIGKDVHAAKVVIAIVGAVALAVLAAAAKALFDHFAK